jgi:hypothetical protein
MVASNVPRVPAYRLHKARQCAVVTLDGRDIYLGVFGSPESQAKYNRLIAEHLRGGPKHQTARKRIRCAQCRPWLAAVDSSCR